MVYCQCPLVVRVVDTTRTGVNGDTLGAPISNFPVLMTAYSPSGDGSVNDQSDIEPDGTGRLEALTDEDGLAAVRWILGTRTGGPDDLTTLRDNNFVVAVAVFADGSQDTVIFRATAVPEAPTNIAASGPIDRAGTAGGTLSGLGVTVSDQYGNLVAGHRNKLLNCFAASRWLCIIEFQLGNNRYFRQRQRQLEPTQY